MPKKEVSASRGRFKAIASNRYVRYGLIPAAVYFLFFSFYSWPWILHFNTWFFTDQGDGFQNVWNMWWVNYSVVHLHQLPWHTTMLHYPYGTSLIGQTMNPFNGFVGIVLINLLRLSLVQSFNIMVIFSFIFGGVTTFWLCYYFTKRYIPALIGGFIFTFSSYHFAHAIGHMQLVSLEWIPLFILLWWRFLIKPKYRTAIATAVVLLLVLLCDYYYFLYSVLAAAMIFIYLWHKKELAPLRERSTYRPFLAFVILALILVPPLPVALVHENTTDPLLGSHNARLFSTDLFSMVIDGGFWHFAALTHWYWRHIKAYIAESSVYFGISTIVLLAIAFWKRNKINRDATFWLVLGVIFVVLSLGPRLMVFGYSINHAVLPYALLTKIFPELNLSGDPDRFIVMAFLAAAILSAMVLARLNLKARKGQLLISIFFVVLFFELWPSSLPKNIASFYPAYVNKLAQLPAGAVLDNGALSQSWQLYDQTITHKPIALGYISRVPTSVQDKDNQLVADASPGRYKLLCSDFGIRYLTIPVSRPIPGNFPVIYNDGQTLIYNLKDSPNC